MISGTPKIFTKSGLLQFFSITNIFQKYKNRWNHPQKYFSSYLNISELQNIQNFRPYRASQLLNCFVFVFKILWVQHNFYFRAFSKNSSGVESWYFRTIIFWIIKHEQILLNQNIFWKSVDAFGIIATSCGIFVFSTNHFLDIFKHK